MVFFIYLLLLLVPTAFLHLVKHSPMHSSTSNPKLRPLLPCTPEQNNPSRPLTFDPHAEQAPNVHYSLSKIYFPYNNEVVDSGWGCAWRCIQMIVNPKSALNFQQLFYTFSSKQYLLAIYQNNVQYSQSLANILKAGNWAPEDASGNWAEPFIAFLVCLSQGLTSDLQLVNAYPGSANAPKEVFSQPLTFSQFRTRLVTHFKNGGGLVMIDDSTFAMIIYGIIVPPEGGDGITLLIADPHILSNQVQTNTGIYQVKLDQKGAQVSHSLTPEQEACMKYKSYLDVYFESKPWMVLFSQLPVIPV